MPFPKQVSAHPSRRYSMPWLIIDLSRIAQAQSRYADAVPVSLRLAPPRRCHDMPIFAAPSIADAVANP